MSVALQHLCTREVNLFQARDGGMGAWKRLGSGTPSALTEGRLARHNEVSMLPWPATWSTSSVLDSNLLNFLFYLPRIHLNPSFPSAPPDTVLAAAPTPWALSRPRSAHAGLAFTISQCFFPVVKSCYVFLENWRSVILSCRCLKKPIYKSAVASIQCPSANTALVHELMLLRKKKCISEG